MATVYSQILLPADYLKPKDELFFQKWRDSSKTKFLSLGTDLNCDNLIDSVFILEKKDGKGIGLFAFLKDEKNNFTVYNLYESTKDKNNYDNLNEVQIEQIRKQYKSAYGIKIANQGSYQTACGKGYYECEEDEPEEVLLKCNGINFFLYESANSFFYWDNIQNKFKRIWISD